jgi:hypothetical protein
MSEIPTNLPVDFVFRGDCAVESKWARAFMNVCGRSAVPKPRKFLSVSAWLITMLWKAPDG